MAASDVVDERLRRARAHYASELGLGRWIVRLLAATTVLSTAAAVAAGSWAVYVTKQAGDRIERYVVFLDDAGNPVRVDLARDAWTPAEGVWAEYAARWVRYLRSRPLDVPTLEYQRREVIEAASRDVYTGLREWMARADRDMGHSAVDFELVSVNVVQSSDRRGTVLVRWKERERRAGQVGDWAAMSGTVTLALNPPEVRKELERNPSGIYVVDFSFSREAA
jgi:type IV secretory pathway TrbF-like protein